MPRRVTCAASSPPPDRRSRRTARRGTPERWQQPRQFLGSAEAPFLRPGLNRTGRRAQPRSRMAEGHRAAARSVLDRGEHGARLGSGRAIAPSALALQAGRSLVFRHVTLFSPPAVRSPAGGPASPPPAFFAPPA